MPRIQVKTPFQYTGADGNIVKFHAGHHTVDADVAAHPFVKAHLGEPDAEAAHDSAELARLRTALAESATTYLAALAANDEMRAQLERSASERADLADKIVALSSERADLADKIVALSTERDELANQVAELQAGGTPAKKK